MVTIEDFVPENHEKEPPNKSSFWEGRSRISGYRGEVPSQIPWFTVPPLFPSISLFSTWRDYSAAPYLWPCTGMRLGEPLGLSRDKVGVKSKGTAAIKRQSPALPRVSESHTLKRNRTISPSCMT